MQAKDSVGSIYVQKPRIDPMSGNLAGGYISKANEYDLENSNLGGSKITK